MTVIDEPLTISLPARIQDMFNDNRDESLICKDGDGVALRGEGKLPMHFSHITNAYEVAQQTGDKIVLDDSLDGHQGAFVMGIYVPHSGIPATPITDSKDSLIMATQEYEQWLNINAMYEAQPNSWSIAHTWLTHHPLFWELAQDGYINVASGQSHIKVQTFPFSERLPVLITCLKAQVEFQTRDINSAYTILAHHVYKNYSTDGSRI